MNQNNSLQRNSTMSQTVECPICFKRFSSDFVQLHAQNCKGSSDAGPAAKKPRISTTHAMISPWKNSVHTKAPSIATPSKTQIIHDKNSTDSSKEFHFVPLAEKCRPMTMDKYVGQEQVTTHGSVLNELLQNSTIPSMILWGPPGCGKTTLANVIATKSRTIGDKSYRFVKLSATNSGKADVQAVVTAAKNDRKMFKRKTILFIDEIHRFNKLQQDTFLPHVEDGTIILIGATTENPSFSLNSSLLSRCRVIVLEKLTSENVKKILVRAVRECIDNVEITNDETLNNNSRVSSLNKNKVESLHQNGKESSTVDGLQFVCISEEAIEALAGLCDGDARIALNGLQMCIEAGRLSQQKSPEQSNLVTLENVKKCFQRSHLLYDRKGDQHYDMISALHKSIRGSDDNATLYWLARMLEGGEDPRFVARRLIRIASEDIGLADSNALNLAVSAHRACQFIGMPECNVVLAQCAVYLSRAPKSAEVYLAYGKAIACIKNHEGPLPGVPLHLRNAPTSLMKSLGYGKDYKYNPGMDDPVVQTYLPDNMLNCNFFTNV